MGESAEPGPAGLLRPAPPGNARWSFDLRRVLSRVDRVAPGRFALATILGYVALSLVAYLPAWPGDPGRLVGYQCVCGDPVQQSWFLGWMPWALLHGHNPLFTNWIDYPIGANLGVNTEMPLLGLLAAPITFAAGSVASFSFLIWLAFPSSATAAFFVLRRWTRSNVASVCGGLLYGFSPYIVGQGFQHLNLSFVPLPPLIFMALYEVVVDQRSRPRRWGAALGLLVTAQYLISPEVLATTLVVAFLALVIVLVTRRRAIDRRRLVHIRRALVPGALISVVLLGYPIYYFFAGPRRFHGPVQGKGINNPFRVDLLGAIVPTSAQRFAPSALVSLGDKFSGGFGENGSYLGIALVAPRAVARRSLPARPGDRSCRSPGCGGLRARARARAHDRPSPDRDTAPLRRARSPAVARGRPPVPVLGLRAVLHRRHRRARSRARIGRGGAPPASASSRRHASAAEEAALTSGDGRAAVGRGRRSCRSRFARPELADTDDPGEHRAAGVLHLLALERDPRRKHRADLPLRREPRESADALAGDGRFPLEARRWLRPRSETERKGHFPAPGSPAAPVQVFLAWKAMGRRGLHGAKPPALNGRLVAELRLYIRRYGVDTVVFDRLGMAPAAVLLLFERALGKPRAEGGVDLWFNAARLRAHRSGQRCTDCRTPATGTPGPRSTPEKLCQTKLRGISSEDSSEKPAQSHDWGDYVTDAVSEDRSRQIQLELVDDAMRDRRTGECSPTTRQRSRGAGTR